MLEHKVYALGRFAFQRIGIHRQKIHIAAVAYEGIFPEHFRLRVCPVSLHKRFAQANVIPKILFLLGGFQLFLDIFGKNLRGV